MRRGRMLHVRDDIIMKNSWPTNHGQYIKEQNLAETYGYLLNSGFEQQIQNHDVDSDIDFEVL